MNKKYFNFLEEGDFCHPLDLNALKALKKAKGLDSVVTWLSRWSYEKVNRIMLMGNCIKCTSTTYGRLYRMLEQACDILNMSIPELYVDQSGEIQAFTSGTSSPVVVLTTALLEAFDDEEILGVIAHELGHIKAKHVLYKQVARMITRGTKILGPIQKLLDFTLLLSLRSWNRKSELTADRASLLVTQNIEIVVSMLMKLSGGSRRLNQEISPADFIRQSEEYERLENGITGNALKLFINLSGTHPFPVMRVSEIVKWSQSEEYQALLEKADDEPKHKNRSEIEKIKDFRLVRLEANRIELTWAAPNIFGIDHYVIHRNRNNGDFSAHKTVANHTFSFKERLPEMGLYKYYLSAADHTGRLFGTTELLSVDISESTETSLQDKFLDTIGKFI